MAVKPIRLADASLTIDHKQAILVNPCSLTQHKLSIDALSLEHILQDHICVSGLAQLEISGVLHHQNERVDEVDCHEFEIAD